MVAVLFTLAAAFFALGTVLIHQSQWVRTLRKQYDGAGTPKSQQDCRIVSANQGAVCNVSFYVENHMRAPVFVYYETTTFLQNHLEYVLSYDALQLLGDYKRSMAATARNCGPLRTVGEGHSGKQLNPCGLVANSLFNDQIMLAATLPGVKMKTTGIAWSGDKNKFNQPGKGRYCGRGCTEFEATEAPSEGEFGVAGCINQTICADDVCDHWFGSSKRLCRGYKCTEPDLFNCKANATFVFFYPDEENQQYLYTTFPEVVSPLEGVENEHFMVWMRTAALSKFQKLYGIIDHDLHEGQVATFKVKANFNVQANDGKKFLVLSTGAWFGGRKTNMGLCMLAVGGFCVLAGLVFVAKAAFPCSRRKVGDLERLTGPGGL